MEPLAAYKRIFLFFKPLFLHCSNAASSSSQLVHNMFVQMVTQVSATQKLVVVTCTFGGVVVVLLSKYFARRRSVTMGTWSIHSLRAKAKMRARQLSFSSKSEPVRTAANPDREPSVECKYNWPELQKASALAADASMDCGISLMDGTPLTPQQLGLMGMEALETVVGYWEDALKAYHTHSLVEKGPSLTNGEESQLIEMLENLLEMAYQLQYESEHMFIHEHSILNRRLSKAGTRMSATPKHSLASRSRTTSIRDSDYSQAGRLSRISSISSVDSFVSAEGSVADLRDFEEVLMVSETDGRQDLYVMALRTLEKEGIRYRNIRTALVGCSNDTEYLAKLHCLRLAFTHIMSSSQHRSWWVDSGRQVFSQLLVQAAKDPSDFVDAYDDLMDYLSVDANLEVLEEELQSRNVQFVNFYDIVLDYILMDSFQDLESPPSSVIAVMKNSWLGNGFKETALHAAVWSVIKAKRKLLRHSHGFKAQFYTLSEIVLPVLAWGFFGPDENLNSLMNHFKDEVLSYIRELFDSNLVRYTCVKDMSEDIMALAESRLVRSMDLLRPALDSE